MRLLGDIQRDAQSQTWLLPKRYHSWFWAGSNQQRAGDEVLIRVQESWVGVEGSRATLCMPGLWKSLSIETGTKFGFAHFFSIIFISSNCSIVA
jgi:hypothetical protein